jgi:signal transduction histidine kinase
VSAILILVLEARDGEAERILGRLSEGGIDGARRAAAPADLEAAREARPDAPLLVVSSAAGADRAVEVLGRARRCREAEEASRGRDEFLSHVAHELRTPLNAMLGWASMLRTRPLDEPSRSRALETIERSARAEARMIEDLLDVSRIITGRLRLEVQEVELGPVLAGAIEAVRPSAAAKEIALLVAIDATVAPFAGDPARLQQVFRTVLSNAVRFTPRSGRVTVRLARSGPRVEIAVSDTGQGLVPEAIPGLFDRLRQGDDPGRRPPGLGLGLTIARHLVEAHGGTLVAESPGEGLGATFTVRLPLVRAMAGTP